MGTLRKVATAGAAAAAAYTVYRVRYKRQDEPVETFVDDVGRVAERVEETVSDEAAPLSAEEDRYGGDEE